MNKANESCYFLSVSMIVWVCVGGGRQIITCTSTKWLQIVNSLDFINLQEQSTALSRLVNLLGYHEKDA